MNKTIIQTVAASIFLLASCTFDPTMVATDDGLETKINTEVTLGETEMVDSPLTTFPNGIDNHNWARTSWILTSTAKETLTSNLFTGDLSLKISRKLCGDFVTADDLNALWAFSNSTSRRFQVIRTRYASFSRRDGAWYLNQVSPLSIAATEGATVGLTAVRIYPASNLSVALVSLSNANASNLMMTNQLPRIANFQWVRVEADAWGAFPIVFAHHNNTRYPLFDDGSSGDRSAGDKTFTASVYIGGATYKHIQFDVLDRPCITNARAPISSTTWDVSLVAYIITDVYE